MPYKEGDRYLYLDTPLGADKLLLQGFKGHESLSQLFEFKLDMQAELSTTVDFDKLIGQKVSFGVLGEAGSEPRHFHGLVVEFAETARDQEFTSFRMTVVPELWKLTKKFKSKIFQHITVPDILKQVLGELASVTYEIQGNFEQREYCTQYQESDFDFVSRLMEEEGIYYFFKFTRGVHKLVLANTPPSHSDIPGESKIIFEINEGGYRDDQRITRWRKAQIWGSGKYTLWDHHFQLPHKKLDADSTVIDSVQAGKIQHKLKLAGNDNLEVYENPGRYAQRFDGIDKSGGEKPADLQKIFKDNKRTTSIRMQQTETPMLLIEGVSNCRQLTSGHKFTLQRHFDADGQYVVTAVEHEALEGDFRSAVAEHMQHYGNKFYAIPFALPFAPPRVTKRPVIAGPQSAVVVGPSGEEIFTDKYGRIKVQFHWDREGKNDADSSCWLRVGTLWAGQNWGGIHIPRIHQEVIVSFLDGDPDRPMVMGSVYNPDQMPPYKLPDHKTVSTFKSRSTKQGSKENFNELRFEDLKGKEQVFFHAERDMDERVKSESREHVSGNRHMIVDKNQKERVDQNKHSKVGQNFVFETDGDQHLTVKGSVKEMTLGSHDSTLGGNNTELTVGKNHMHVVGDQMEKIDGAMSLTVGQSIDSKNGTKYAHEAGMEIHLKAGMKVVIEAGLELTLKGPGGFIDISPMGVTIQGLMVLINSGGMAGSGSGSSPTAPLSPAAVNPPEPPDTADDGTKFDKL